MRPQTGIFINEKKSKNKYDIEDVPKFNPRVKQTEVDGRNRPFKIYKIGENLYAKDNNSQQSSSIFDKDKDETSQQNVKLVERSEFAFKILQS